MASDLWSGAVFRRAKGVSFGRPRLVNEKLQTGARALGSSHKACVERAPPKEIGAPKGAPVLIISKIAQFWLRARSAQ